MRQIVFFLFFLLLVTACKPDENNIDFGFDYFPIEEQGFVSYDVTQIYHDKDLIPQHDTIRYRLTTVIGEEVVDNSGRLARKFFQYRYDITTGALIDQRVWTRIIDEGKRGEVVEENQRIIRLVFPVKEGQEWNINAYNTWEKEQAYIADKDVERTVNGHALSQTAKVVHADFISLVDFKKKHEVYARGIGLVERSFKDLRINNFDSLQIQKGEEVHYQLVDYGK